MLINKDPTGVTHQPKDFRKFSKCVTCGHHSKKENSKCGFCIVLDLVHCVSCDIILRKESYFSYSYDNKLDYRPEEVKFLASKKIIREFYTENDANCTFKEDMCDYCLELEQKNLMKNNCFNCKQEFSNTLEHWRMYGNYCKKCDSSFSQVDSERERRKYINKKLKKELKNENN